MKKLFWDDPYATECTAKVTHIDGRTVKLDQSIFYAFSGGQASDEGTIGNIKVITAIKQGAKEDIIDIEYELESDPLFKVGDVVEVKINEVRRQTLRRLHSAAHLVYYVVKEKLGELKVIGSNVSIEKARMDYEYPEPVTSLIADIEEKANNIIKENRPIVMKYDENKADLRWWTCGEWKMPCGGTHCTSTGEIGPLKLKRANIGKGKERIEMLLTT